MKRFLRYFLYGLFYLAILGGIGYFVYLRAIKPAPTCFDGIQNQGEQGVDCGGPCARVCTPGLKPAALSGQAQIFALPGGRVSASFLAGNPNADYAIKDMNYKFTLYDAAGSPIETVDGRSFIYANEFKYIIAPAIDIGSSVPASADFSATDTVWITADNFAAPKLTVQSPSISESSTSIAITGRLINQDTTTFPSTLLIAVFTNGFGDQIGVAQTTLENLTPGETRNFTIIHPPISGVNLSGTRIFPYAKRP